MKGKKGSEPNLLQEAQLNRNIDGTFGMEGKGTEGNEAEHSAVVVELTLVVLLGGTGKDAVCEMSFSAFNAPSGSVVGRGVGGIGTHPLILFEEENSVEVLGDRTGGASAAAVFFLIGGPLKINKKKEKKLGNK